MKKYSLLKRFLIWRLRHINNRQFIMILSVIIGLAAGFAAVIIKNSVHFIQEILHSGITEEFHKYWYFAFPLVGILLAVIITKFVIRRRVGHGIPNVLYAISKSDGKIKSHNMFSSIITSALTVGFGGSVGLEGPTVSTGAAIGSNIGRLFHLNYKQTTLLLGCACTGAMASIFKAPIAAIVFALEVIMLDLKMSSLVPLLMASASAALTSYFFLGQDVLYPISITDTFHLNELPLYILLGILTGLVSVYFTRSYMFVGGFFEKISGTYQKLLVGGGLLGIIVFIFPALFGEGYEVINSCLSGDYSYVFNHSFFHEYQDSIIAAIILLSLLVVFKVIAASLTFGAGGVGGIFAPTLFMGANTGMLFATIVNHLGFKQISTSNFALIGMAGMIAGVLHAPLTAIFLIGDITAGYQLFMPLMITATISYATIKYFESNSVYTIQLAKRKHLMTHDKDKAVLSLMKVEKLLETNFKTVDENATLGDLVKIVSNSTRNIFPVIDTENNFRGIVILDDIRHIMFKPDMYENTYVRDLMFTPIVHVTPDDSMEDVAKKIHTTGRFNIVVLKDGKYLGFISRANVFSSYRRRLKHFSED